MDSHLKKNKMGQKQSYITVALKTTFLICRGSVEDTQGKENCLKHET